MAEHYRNNGSLPLDYSDSGGPTVAPGEVFAHEIPPEQLVSHLRSGFISRVADAADDAPTTRTIDTAPMAAPARGRAKAAGAD